MLGPELDGETKYCGGGVLAPGRKIYFAPSCASHVICIDPETHTARMLGPELDGLYKYMGGGVLAPNGKIYCAPTCASHVLCIDPNRIPQRPEVAKAAVSRVGYALHYAYVDMQRALRSSRLL